jgi:hypothetical protein
MLLQDGNNNNNINVMTSLLVVAVELGGMVVCSSVCETQPAAGDAFHRNLQWALGCQQQTCGVHTTYLFWLFVTAVYCWMYLRELRLLVAAMNVVNVAVRACLHIIMDGRKAGAVVVVLNPRFLHTRDSEPCPSCARGVGDADIAVGADCGHAYHEKCMMDMLADQHPCAACNLPMKCIGYFS